MPPARLGGFDFGDFSAGQEEEPLAPLSWRDDPESSLSDWTISVVTPDGSTEEYHVHKAMLAAGARPSEYWKGVFRGAGATMREGSDRTSQLCLRISAAKAFPIYLDFCYTGELGAKTESATALLHLAGYLRCRKLHEAVVELMQSDLIADTAALYLAEAESYSLDKVAAAALPLCASSLPTRRPDLVLALPPALFQRVVLSSARTCSSEALSALVADYCHGPHADAIDGDFLASVSTDALMPSVDPAEAFRLLELAVAHEPASGLKERCADACASHWQQALLPALAGDLEAASKVAQPLAAGRPKRRRGAASPAVDARSPDPVRHLGATVPDAIKVDMLARALKCAGEELKCAGEELEKEKRAASQREQALRSNNRKLITEKQAASQREQALSSQLSKLISEKSEVEWQLRRFRPPGRPSMFGPLPSP